MKTPLAIGADIYAGLFSYGVKRAGFHVAAHFESGGYGMPTAQLNFPKLDIYKNRDDWGPGVKKYRQESVELVYTNPPCAPWSQWNSQATNWKTDDRIACTEHNINLALDLDTASFVWESVIGAWNRGREYVLDQALKFADEGYSITILLQNNMYLGSVQNRKRMMFIAHRYPIIWGKFTQPQTLYECLDGVVNTPQDLEDAKACDWEVKLWRKAESMGIQSMRDAYYALPEKERDHWTPSYMTARLEGNRPTPLITCHRFHPDEPRFFTWPEKLRLAGLPANWKNGVPIRKGRMKSPARNRAIASDGELQRAVLPPVGKWVAASIKRGFTQPMIEEPVYLVFDVRRPTSPVTKDISKEVFA